MDGRVEYDFQVYMSVKYNNVKGRGILRCDWNEMIYVRCYNGCKGCSLEDEVACELECGYEEVLK